LELKIRFHSTSRCTTCRTIERYSKEAIDKYFVDELKNGILEFKPVNVDEPENRHYIQDYQLYTRSLVLIYGIGTGLPVLLFAVLVSA
jgi:hypothetical protein